MELRRGVVLKEGEGEMVDYGGDGGREVLDVGGCKNG